MKTKTREILEDKISTGITMGLRRSYKHVLTCELPRDEQDIGDHIERAVWECIFEAFDFSDEREDGEVADTLRGIAEILREPKPLMNPTSEGVL